MSNELDFIFYNNEMYSRYELAMKMKSEGNIDEVERLLLPSVIPPSIYHGHYRELFINWRKKIYLHEKAAEYSKIVSLIKLMIKLDAELLHKMREYWSPIHGVDRSPEYFFRYSKIKKTDLKKLQKYSEIIGDMDGKFLAESLLNNHDC
ncbi:hypothetical protein [Rosenbergiella epipactidis]|uniref:hypothetical protein n=1 Tax=Rosenbergiella epipactidis TaxID=1544694 RepID=UPI001F4D72E7|nr:hypothetical protein [Rosenbergiella epipactidis]